MKLILLHGNFQDSLLKKLSQIKKSFDPLSITESHDFNLASQGLFSEKRLVVLENPDIKTVEKLNPEKDSDLTVVLKFSKNLEKSSAVLKRITDIKGEILVFNETTQTSVFPLLDMLGLKSRNTFGEFEKNYSEFGGQYLLTMLAYFLRRMVQIPKSGSGFMNQKIETQKRNFSIDKIINLYKELIETDFKIKQGLVEEKLAVTLLIQKILD